MYYSTGYPVSGYIFRHRVSARRQGDAALVYCKVSIEAAVPAGAGLQASCIVLGNGSRPAPARSWNGSTHDFAVSAAAFSIRRLLTGTLAGWREPD